MKNLGLIFSVLLLLQQCDVTPKSTSPTSAPGGPSAWIDAPLDGSRLPLAPVEIVSHTSDPSHIAQVELNVNGDVVRRDPNPDLSKDLVTLQQPWSPAASGNYTVLVRAQSTTGAWGEYARVVVTVEGGTAVPTAVGRVPPTITPSGGPVTLTPAPPLVTRAPGITVAPTPIPPVRPPAPTAVPPSPTPIPPSPTTFIPVRTLPTPTHTSAPPSVPSFGAPTVSTNQFYYQDSHCGAKQVTVGIPVSDPDGIASVEMYYRLSNKGLPNGTTSTASHAMTLVRGGAWTVTINSESDIPGYNTYPSGAWFQFWMIATDTKGMPSQSPLYGNMVTLTVCAPAIR